VNGGVGNVAIGILSTVSGGNEHTALADNDNILGIEPEVFNPFIVLDSLPLDVELGVFQLCLQESSGDATCFLEQDNTSTWRMTGTSSGFGGCAAVCF
jgi:hypothetical protein